MKYGFLLLSLIFSTTLQARVNSWEGSTISVQFNSLTEVDFNVNEITNSFSRYAFEAYVQDKTFLPIEALSENKDYCRLTLNLETNRINNGPARVSVMFDSSYNQLYYSELVLGEHISFENDTPKIKTVVWSTRKGTSMIRHVSCFSQDLNQNLQLERIFPDTLDVRVLR